MTFDMFEVKVVIGWIFGRILLALIIFQILGVAMPWEPGLSAVARLIAVAAVPGVFELLLVPVLASGGDF